MMYKSKKETIQFQRINNNQKMKIMNQLKKLPNLLLVLFFSAQFSIIAQNATEQLSKGQQEFKSECEESAKKPNFIYNCDCLTSRYPSIVETLKKEKLGNGSNNSANSRQSMNNVRLEQMCEKGEEVVLIRDSTKSIGNPKGEVRLIYRAARRYPDTYKKISACDALEEIKSRPAPKFEDVPEPPSSHIWLRMNKEDDCKDYDLIYKNGLLKSEYYLQQVLGTNPTDKEKEEYQSCFAKKYADEWMKQEGGYSPRYESTIMSKAVSGCKK